MARYIVMMPYIAMTPIKSLAVLYFLMVDVNLA
jgi:hypothetical protein